jgi:hypothetical protein
MSNNPRKSILSRSLLSVPVNNPRFVEKAFESDADKRSAPCASKRRFCMRCLRPTSTQINKRTISLESPVISEQDHRLNQCLRHQDPVKRILVQQR